jgi:hypothetical protein
MYNYEYARKGSIKHLFFQQYKRYTENSNKITHTQFIDLKQKPGSTRASFASLRIFKVQFHGEIVHGIEMLLAVWIVTS